MASFAKVWPWALLWNRLLFVVMLCFLKWRWLQEVTHLLDLAIYSVLYQGCCLVPLCTCLILLILEPSVYIMCRLLHTPGRVPSVGDCCHFSQSWDSEWHLPLCMDQAPRAWRSQFNNWDWLSWTFLYGVRVLSIGDWLRLGYCWYPGQWKSAWKCFL